MILDDELPDLEDRQSSQVLMEKMPPPPMRMTKYRSLDLVGRRLKSEDPQRKSADDFHKLPSTHKVTNMRNIYHAKTEGGPAQPNTPFGGQPVKRKRSVSVKLLKVLSSKDDKMLPTPSKVSSVGSSSGGNFEIRLRGIKATEKK